MNCPYCGRVNSPEARFCAECGKDMTSAATAAPPSSSFPPPPGQFPSPPIQQAPPNFQAPGNIPTPGSTYYPAPSGSGPSKGLAVAALIVSLIALFTASFFLIGGLAGVVIAIVALAKIKREPARYTGTGIAVAGAIISVFSIAVGVTIFLMVIMVPNMSLATRRVNEINAITRLRAIDTAEAAFNAEHDRYGELSELVQERLITVPDDPHGYLVEVKAGEGAFEATAVPERYGKYGTGLRSFYVDEDHIIRESDKAGAAPDRSAPPLQ